MRKCTVCLLAAGALGLFACTTAKENGVVKPPLETVAFVDLGKYMGAWYEIGRYPNRFQKDCQASQATYSLRPDGNVKVVNACRKGSATGKLKTIEGKAWVVDPATNARLKVQFFWPFSGDYWIIQLDTQYRYAVVGHPERTYLWILSRTPTLDPATTRAIDQKLIEQGYDPARIIRN